MRRSIWRLARIGVAGAALAALVAVGVAAWQADRRVQDEPPIAASAGPSVLVLGTGGDVVASRGGFVGRALTPDELPKHLVDAVVAIEDRRFFEHHGIDLRGLVRAASANF
ncbi:MAG: transglycosylase domain-containing protein, partial [Alphaproteobacteria bacterium]|nr:transglycosylase domain-containing protein [Alphaproteobacteria bacterium]